jgi:hypothetical protein
MNGNEHLERVQAMSEDNGQTWDLSRNDQAALRHVLDLIELMAEEIAGNEMLTSEVIANCAKIIQARKQ